jgi:hypothetical protein
VPELPVNFHPESLPARTDREKDRDGSRAVRSRLHIGEGDVVAKYMVFYNTTAAMRDQMAQIPPEQAAAGMQDWTTWGERVGDRLVDMGSPLENEGDADVQVSGYSVIDADSADQLTGFLEGHPHTAAGGTISTQKFREIPGM